jgi:protein phosphatase
MQKAIEITKDCKNSDEMTDNLLKFALKNGSRDNTSVLVLKFS